jgi:hypothetical protein
VTDGPNHQAAEIDELADTIATLRAEVTRLREEISRLRRELDGTPPHHR